MSHLSLNVSEGNGKQAMTSEQKVHFGPDPTGRQNRKAEDSVYEHCIMLIATGKWPSGSKMPSVREAEALFGVNRVAVHEAYKRLASQRIAVARPRAGYFVSDQEDVRRISGNRVVLENLYHSFAETIAQSTGLASLPVFRYLTRLARIRDKEAPSCAFAECTEIQSQTHTAEIADRLQVSVLSMTLDDIAGRRDRIPRDVRVLLTTHFHYAELAPLREAGDLEVVAVPIEVSPEVAALVKNPGKALLLLKDAQETAGTVAEDAGRRLGRGPLEVRIETDLHGTLADILGPLDSVGKTEAVVFVSPREWVGMGERWRSHPNVHLMPFRIEDAAWDLIADVVGMPLGALG
jgi:DNA-binding transcriptional regulator YhcF (GntR family)